MSKKTGVGVTKPNMKHVMERVNRIPALQWIGGRLVEVSEGRARLELPFRNEFCNSLGMVQGGFVTAIADAAGGLALVSLLPPGWATPTIELKINFLVPIRGKIVATGRVLRCGSRVGSSYVEVHLENDTLAAAGIATYRLVSPESLKKNKLLASGI